MSEKNQPKELPLEILMTSLADDLYAHIEGWLGEELLFEVYCEEENGSNRIRIFNDSGIYDREVTEFLEMVRTLDAKLTQTKIDFPPQSLE